MSDAFALKLGRLEELVRALEMPEVTLDASVAYFTEGKKLAEECESLLVAAEEAIADATETPDDDEDDDAEPGES